MTPIICEKLSPPRARSPSFPTTRHGRSNTRSTNISMPSATLVECCFSKLKQFGRVATRFEKTARNYQAVVTLAAIILWMR